MAKSDTIDVRETRLHTVANPKRVRVAADGSPITAATDSETD